MRIVLGIDGGGTKTRCLAADRTGRILGEGLSGPSNYQAVGREAAAASLRAAVQQALGVAGAALADVDAVCAGLAGVGRPGDEAPMVASLSFLPQARIQVVPDARVALAGALNGAPGAIVISGTGSIAYGLEPSGQVVRAGGWGWILGDEGSGYWIGREAVQAALAALDGTGPATALGPAICEAWQLARLDQVVGKVYGDLVAAKGATAALVPGVLKAAEGGDAVARAILERAGSALAALAAAVLNRLQLTAEKPAPVAVTGGVLTGSRLVRAAMQTELAELVPHASLTDCLKDPAEGAVQMALRASVN